MKKFNIGINTDFQVAKDDRKLRDGLALSNLDGKLWEEMGHKIGQYFGYEPLVRARVGIEARYLIALSEFKVIRKFSKKEKRALLKVHEKITPKAMKRLATIDKKIRHDVISANVLLREILNKEDILKDITSAGWLHWGMTSEDIDNLGRGILMKNFISKIYLKELKILLDNISDFSASNKNVVIPGKTHIQTAVPTTLGREIALFGVRLSQQATYLSNVKMAGKLGSAVGTLAAQKTAYPKVDWEKFSKMFVESLGLEHQRFTTQIENRERLLEILNSMALINSILIDMSQDMRLMIGFGWLSQEVKKGEGGSSTMPQKVNPIDFENSFGNAHLSNWILQGLISQLPISWLQRDLSDKTILRNIGLPFGYSYLSIFSSSKGLKRAFPNHTKIKSELDEDWSIVSEGLQIYLRSIGKGEAYKTLKELSRGNKLTKEDVKEWIESLDITNKQKIYLRKITPKTYVGYSEKQTVEMIRKINKQANNL